VSAPPPLLADAVSNLRPYVEVALLDHADVQVAATVARVLPGTDPDVLLALALTVRATRLGHVCLVLDDVPDALVLANGGSTGTPEGGASDAERLAALPWPDRPRWDAALATSEAVALVDPGSATPRAAVHDRTLRPLVYDGRRVYLERYWRHERGTGDDLLARAAAGRAEGDRATAVGHLLDRLFPAVPGDADDRQRRAAAAALERHLVVVAGGPGTGKTRTVARLLVALHLQAADVGRPLEVALAAPTGKAAKRMTEAVHEAVLEVRLTPEETEPLLATSASTLHRLLGPTGGVGFRHHRANPLPHDVVVVDEASMISLPLMARLLDAVRPDARLVLVGDPHQLASIEAGAVLGDVVGGAVRHHTGPLAESVVVLERVHRFGAHSSIAALADAVRRGDADGAVALLEVGSDDVTWVRPDDTSSLRVLEDDVVANAVATASAGLDGDASAGLARAGELKVLAATRAGPLGTWDWQDRIERRAAAALPGLQPHRRWYAGRPVLVTRNDPLHGLVNGDTGLTVQRDGVLAVAFPDPGGADGVRSLAPSQLDAVDTWWAMTIHKSQGSEYDHAVVSLPWAASRILTRELLYTGITRARSRVTVVGSEEAVRAAVARPVARASGLAPRLWPD
jgi:exodeoxyribonuclease V alpha subunit